MIHIYACVWLMSRYLRDTYTHKGTEHVYSSMCHTVVVSF